MRHRPFFDDASHLDEEGVALATDALLLGKSEALPGSVQDHLELCLRCKEELASHYSLALDIRLRPADPHPYFDRAAAPGDARDSTGSLYRIAALIIAALGLGIVGYFVGGEIQKKGGRYAGANRSSRDTALVHVPERPLTSGDTVFAANFVPSPGLDQLVGANFRSEQIRILSPPAGRTAAGQPVLFRWTGRAPGPVTVQLLSNTGKLLFERETPGDRIEYTGRLIPGLYYWKLVGREDLLAAGKFTVK
jgi:hypothetical protein